MKYAKQMVILAILITNSALVHAAEFSSLEFMELSKVQRCLLYMDSSSACGDLKLNFSRLQILTDELLAFLKDDPSNTARVDKISLGMKSALESYKHAIAANDQALAQQSMLNYTRALNEENVIAG